jgi:hypothetical protein
MIWSFDMSKNIKRTVLSDGYKPRPGTTVQNGYKPASGGGSTQSPTRPAPPKTTSSVAKPK